MAYAERHGPWYPRRRPAPPAAALTALLLLPFLAGPPPAGTVPQALRSSWVEVRLLALDRPAAPAPSVAPVLTPPLGPPVRRPRPLAAEQLPARPPATVPEPSLDLAPVPEALAAPAPVMPPAGPPAVSASTQAITPTRPPLQLDAATLGRAARQSGGEFRRLAESSGAYAGDPPATAPERFEQAVRQAAKPDCLRPGGSLLSAAVIAYELLADRCSAR